MTHASNNQNLLRESIEGVSIDDEMVDLSRFPKAFRGQREGDGHCQPLDGFRTAAGAVKGGDDESKR